MTVAKQGKEPFDLILASSYRVAQLRYAFLSWIEKSDAAADFEAILDFCSCAISPWPEKRAVAPPKSRDAQRVNKMFCSIERHVDSFRKAEKEGNLKGMSNDLVQVADFLSDMRSLCEPGFLTTSFAEVKGEALKRKSA